MKNEYYGQKFKCVSCNAQLLRKNKTKNYDVADSVESECLLLHH